MEPLKEILAGVLETHGPAEVIQVMAKLYEEHMQLAHQRGDRQEASAFAAVGAVLVRCAQQVAAVEGDE
jgi:hypothetical protein